jgi:hypothetical protein
MLLRLRALMIDPVVSPRDRRHAREGHEDHGGHKTRGSGAKLH